MCTFWYGLLGPAFSSQMQSGTHRSHSRQQAGCPAFPGWGASPLRRHTCIWNVFMKAYSSHSRQPAWRSACPAGAIHALWRHNKTSQLPSQGLTGAVAGGEQGGLHVRLGLCMRQGLGHIVQGPAEVLVLALARFVHSAAQHVQRLLLRQQLLQCCVLCGGAGRARRDTCMLRLLKTNAFLSAIYSMPNASPAPALAGELHLPLRR